MGNLNKTYDELLDEIILLKKRNEELEFSEKLYKTLFDNSDDGFEIVEPIYDNNGIMYDYRWIKVNESWEKHVGVKSVEAEGKRASDIYSAVEDYWLEKYERVIRSGKSERYEVYGEDTKRWFDCYCFPYSKERVGIVFRDITNKKQAENALKESEKLYRTLFENTEDIFQINELIYDEFGKVSDYKIIKVNSAFEVQTGLKSEDVIGKQAKSIFKADLSSRIKEFEKVKNNNRVERYEYYSEHTNLWYDVLCFPYDNGQVGELFRNISERKEYESKIALHAEILSNIQDAVIVIDENNIITYCNHAYLNLFGWNEREQIGKSIYSFINTYIDAGSKTVIGRLLKDSNLPEVFQLKELSCFSKNGNNVIVDINISKLKGANDGLKGYICSIKDVSNRVEHLNRLQKSDLMSKKLIEKLRKADENKNEFLNILSHEIRNPMAAAMVSLSLLNNVDENSEQAAKAKITLNRQLEHLSGLVDDLLDITRIKNKKIKLNKEILEINELIQNVVKDNMLQFDNKKIDLEFEPALNTLFIEADKVRVIQVIDNLLSNALKFTQSSGKTNVNIKSDRIKYEVLITVKDTGIGIAPELQTYLFDPFTQVDNSMDRSNGGLGLGLAIVKGIAELHGGSVEVFSEGIGKGSQFTVRLPLVSEMAEKTDSFSDEKIASSKALDVLMIDDNKALVEIICELIGILGHRVESASNGKEGIFKAKQSCPDVIICDIGMPIMNGYEVAEFIRNDNELKNVYLIALSGYAQQEDIERSRKAGFNKHIAKPLSLETLKTVLEQISS